MKTELKILSVTMLIALLMNSGFSQEAQQSFVPYYLQDGKVQEFERASAKIEARAIGYGGYGGINNYLTVFDSKESNVRFKKGKMPIFVIVVEEGIDVFELVVVSKADKVKRRKTYRRFVQGGSSYGGGAKDLSKYIAIPELKNVGENRYEMLFDEPFEPGEYAFKPIYHGKQGANVYTNSGSVRIYCFGVDE